jgi:hypothetical protein
MFRRKPSTAELWHRLRLDLNVLLEIVSDRSSIAKVVSQISVLIIINFRVPQPVPDIHFHLLKRLNRNLCCLCSQRLRPRIRTKCVRFSNERSSFVAFKAA